jgi:transposase-like protein
MMRAVMCGVSTRKVSGLRETDLRGESKSSLSRLWKEKAKELVEQMQQDDLSTFDLVVLMLDGVVLAKGLVATVALGIDSSGCKRILGFRIGASENAEVCSDLLSNLSRRGLSVPSNRLLLALLDGSSALEKGVLRQYPNALIQRCLVHKQRNIRGYHSKRHWKELGQLFKRLRQSQGSEGAEEAAGALRCFLEQKNAQALASLEEAGDSFLCVMKLEIPNTLYRSLLSTNAIENSFKNLRRHIGRVCRWREDTSQADLWVASGLILAEKGFQKIQGHKEMAKLIASLEKAQNDLK